MSDSRLQNFISFTLNQQRLMNEVSTLTTSVHMVDLPGTMIPQQQHPFPPKE